MTIFIAVSIRNSSVSQYFIELANNLSKGHEVFIFADFVGQHNFYVSPDIKVVQWRNHPQRINSFFFLSNYIRNYEPEILIGNFSAVGPFLLVGFLHRVPHRIAWCHSISKQFIEKRPFIDKKRWIYKFATLLIANSVATKKDLIQNFAVKKNLIKVFYNAFKDPFVENPANRNLIGFAGRLDKSKGVDILFNALPEVIKEFPEIKLKILGVGTQLSSLRALAQELKIEKNIEFLGNQPREKVLEVFSTCYFTVVPSRVEAFGYVVIESFAVKIPVIGSHTSGIAEIIRDGQDGFLVDLNPQSLSKQMVFILKNPELRQEMSNSCYERFKKEFELNKIVNEISNYISSLKIRSN